MRWNKKRTTAVIAALVGISFTAGVFAAESLQKVEAYLRADFTVMLDGKPVTLDKPLLVYDDKSYLPVKNIADLLNVTVNWDEATKSIYITSRYAGQPEAPSDTYEDYQKITMQYPIGFKVTYMGKEYPMLAIGVGSQQYYRVSDLSVMGVDTGGLRKYKDTMTSFLYVRKDEVNQLWVQKPVIKTMSDPVVAKETDQEKIDALLDIVTRVTKEFMKDEVDGFTINPSIFNIEVKPNGDNEYILYSLERNKVYHYYVKLVLTNNEDPALWDKVKDDEWYYDPITKLRRKWSYSNFSRIDPATDTTDKEIQP